MYSSPPAAACKPGPGRTSREPVGPAHVPRTRREEKGEGLVRFPSPTSLLPHAQKNTLIRRAARRPPRPTAEVLRRRDAGAQPDGRRVRIPAPEPRATPPPAPAPPLRPPLPPVRAAASSEDALVKGRGGGGADGCRAQSMAMADLLVQGLFMFVHDGSVLGLSCRGRRTGTFL
nr:basic proline-rich protein-like [Aegilops tauschii subsp. strangulata]